jgi:hypothetical protein
MFIIEEIRHNSSSGNTKTGRVEQARIGSNKYQYLYVKCVTVLSGGIVTDRTARLWPFVERIFKNSEGSISLIYIDMQQLRSS